MRRAALTPLATICFVLAAVCTAIIAYGWLPLDSHATWLAEPLVFLSMLLAIASVLPWAAAVRARTHLPGAAIPGWYWPVLVGSVAYYFGVFFLLPSSEGTDLSPLEALRVFSAFSLLLCMSAAGFAQGAPVVPPPAAP